MRYLMLFLCCGTVMLTLTSCQAKPVQRAGLAAARDFASSALAARDFGSYVHTWRFYQPGSTEGTVKNEFALIQLRQMEEGSFRSYAKTPATAKEAKLLAVVELPTGFAFSTLQTYQKVAGYFRTHRKLPRNAAECLEYFDSEKGQEFVSTQSEAKALSFIAPLIDPLTGRLYASFDNADQPFGFHFEFRPLTGADFSAGGALPAALDRAGKDCGCGAGTGAAADEPSTVAVGGAADGGGGFRVKTPDGSCPVSWECTVTRTGEQPGTVIERCKFIF